MVLPTIQFLTVPNSYLTYKMDQPSNVAVSKVSKILLPQNSLNSRMKQKKLSNKKKSKKSSKAKLQIELLKQHIENIKIERIKLSLENEELRLSLNKPSDFKSQSSHSHDLETLCQMLGLSEKSTPEDNKNHTALSNDSCSQTSEFKDRTSSDEDSGISSESDNQSDMELQEDSWMEDFFSVLRHKNESEVSLKCAEGLGASVSRYNGSDGGEEFIQLQNSTNCNSPVSPDTHYVSDSSLPEGSHTIDTNLHYFVTPTTSQDLIQHPTLPYIPAMTVCHEEEVTSTTEEDFTMTFNENPNEDFSMTFNEDPIEAMIDSFLAKDEFTFDDLYDHLDNEGLSL